MKLLRFGPEGAEKPGILDANEIIRDLSSVIDDLTADTLGPESLAKISAVNPASLAAVKDSVRLGSPIGSRGKFIAIGLNYHDHAKEVNAPIPEEPVIFLKANSCMQGPNDPVVIPRGSTKTDWEVELGIVIGTRGSYIEASQALDHVAGYCVVNDISERAYQMERGGTWDKGKGCDTFGPIGPWLVTPDEITDPQNLDLWLDVNGERMQTGNTRTMIFDVKTVISYVSQFMTLEPGDVITTGTPPGVGLGKIPPKFLKEGDVMSLGIHGLGNQKQSIVSWQPA